jgi:hypothetical protein
MIKLPNRACRVLINNHCLSHLGAALTVTPLILVLHTTIPRFKLRCSNLCGYGSLSLHANEQLPKTADL